MKLQMIRSAELSNKLLNKLAFISLLLLTQVLGKPLKPFVRGY